MKNALLMTAVLLTGCAGTLTYTPPNKPAAAITKQLTINAPRDAVWDRTIPKIAKQFFVINTIDKSSGIIGLSYSGDPQSFVDCGRIRSEVSRPTGKQVYDFPASQAEAIFETYDSKNQDFYVYTRQLMLTGRINMIFEALDASTTRITANVLYELNRKITATTPGKPPVFSDDSARATGNEPINLGSGVKCWANGEMEKLLLEAAQ